MKKRLKEMEDEAAALREMQAKVEKEMSSVQGLFLLFLAFPNAFSAFLQCAGDFPSSRRDFCSLCHCHTIILLGSSLVNTVSVRRILGWNWFFFFFKKF